MTRSWPACDLLVWPSVVWLFATRVHQQARTSIMVLHYDDLLNGGCCVALLRGGAGGEARDEVTFMWGSGLLPD